VLIRRCNITSAIDFSKWQKCDNEGKIIRKEDHPELIEVMQEFLQNKLNCNKRKKVEEHIELSAVFDLSKIDANTCVLVEFDVEGEAKNRVPRICATFRPQIKEEVQGSILNDLRSTSKTAKVERQWRESRDLFKSITPTVIKQTCDRHRIELPEIKCEKLFETHIKKKEGDFNDLLQQLFHSCIDELALGVADTPEKAFDCLMKYMFCRFEERDYQIDEEYKKEFCSIFNEIFQGSVDTSDESDFKDKILSVLRGIEDWRSQKKGDTPILQDFEVQDMEEVVKYMDLTFPYRQKVKAMVQSLRKGSKPDQAKHGGGGGGGGGSGVDSDEVLECISDDEQDKNEEDEEENEDKEGSNASGKRKREEDEDSEILSDSGSQGEDFYQPEKGKGNDDKESHQGKGMGKGMGKGGGDDLSLDGSSSDEDSDDSDVVCQGKGMGKGKGKSMKKMVGNSDGDDATDEDEDEGASYQGKGKGASYQGKGNSLSDADDQDNNSGDDEGSAQGKGNSDDQDNNPGDDEGSAQGESE
jgi:hypothetical protein